MVTTSAATVRLASKVLAALLACLGLAACGSPATTVNAPGSEVEEAVLDVAEVIGIDIEADIQVGPLNCPGGPGCPCTGNGDCNSALCLDTPDGKQCASSFGMPRPLSIAIPSEKRACGMPPLAALRSHIRPVVWSTEKSEKA